MCKVSDDAKPCYKNEPGGLWRAMEIDLFVELARPPGPDGVPPPVSDVYDDLIAIAKAADQLGIGAIWLPEHHFLGDYSASAAPDMLLAAIALLLLLLEEMLFLQVYSLCPEYYSQYQLHHCLQG